MNLTTYEVNYITTQDRNIPDDIWAQYSDCTSLDRFSMHKKGLQRNLKLYSGLLVTIWYCHFETFTYKWVKQITKDFNIVKIRNLEKNFYIFYL